MKLVKRAGKTTVKMSKKEWEDIGEKAGWIVSFNKEFGLLKEGDIFSPHNSYYESYVLIDKNNPSVISNLSKVYEKIISSCKLNASLVRKIYSFLSEEGYNHDQIIKEIENMQSTLKDAVQRRERKTEELKDINFS